MACKISKKTVHREITNDEFVRQKEDPYYNDLRQLGKITNFLTIFGGSPKTFVQNALETKWTEEQADAYIKENHLEKARERIADRYRQDSSKMISLITVGSHLQDKFFEGYEGLNRRIKRNQQFAQSHGYVRCRSGATRNLIEELLRGSYDDRELSGHMRNLDNICANTDIQNFEAFVIHPAMAEVNLWLEENNMLSFGWNCVHDSHDLCVHKTELKVVADKIEEVFTRAIPELEGVPLAVDFMVSDMTKGEYYKGGSKLRAYL